MDIAKSFKRLVRAALGGDPDREAPQFDLLAHYSARVMACSSDGSKVDLQPDDVRIPPRQNVPVVTGVPGLSAVVQAGAVVWMGWEGGDPSRPRAVPCWEGATVQELVFAAVALYLGGKTGAERVLTTGDLAAVKLAISGAAVTPNDGGATLKTNILAAWPAAPGSTKIMAVR